MPTLTVREDPVAEPLVLIPESGMGFQVVAAIVSFRGPDDEDYTVEGDFLAMASAQLFVYHINRDFGDFTLARVEDLRQFSLENEFPPPVDVLEIRSPRILASRLGPFQPPPSPPTYLHPQPNPVSGRTRSHESFCRYSTSSRDRRVTPDGGLVPDTYTTTFNDSKLVPSGFAAVGRYALPDPRPARYLHVITPPKQTDVVYGAVVPNFSQAGGGVEALFPYGARNKAQGFQMLPEG